MSDEQRLRFISPKKTDVAYRSVGSLPIPPLTATYSSNISNTETQSTTRKKPTKYQRSSGTTSILPAKEYDEEQKENTESNIEVVTQKSAKIVPTQNIFTKYLKPTPLNPPGDLILEQEPDKILPPESPLHIIEGRHEVPKVKPPPIIVRDKPMKKPEPIPEQHIIVPGKVLPAPNRQVIIERLPSPPTPPPDIIYEKWLPYDELPPRRVVYKPAPPVKPLPPQPNILIQWEKPEMEISKSYNHLATEVVDPDLYVAQHNLDYVDCSRKYTIPNLIGDVKYLSLIDLDKHGLSEYKEQVNRFLSNKLK